MGRRTKTRLPTTTRSLRPRGVDHHVKAKRYRKKTGPVSFYLKIRGWSGIHRYGNSIEIQKSNQFDRRPRGRNSMCFHQQMYQRICVAGRDGSLRGFISPRALLVTYNFSCSEFSLNAHQSGRVLGCVPLPRPAGLDSVLSLKVPLYRTLRTRK